MPRFHTSWTVLPHGPVEKLDEGLFAVDGEIHMPLGKFPRRMSIVTVTGGRTAVFSPIALREPEMREVEGLGEPAFMIVPNGFHRLDSRIWKSRYPQIKVICPPGARRRVEQAVPVDATSDVLGDPAVQFVVVPGMREGEGALIVRRTGDTTLILNDVISNVRQPKGIGANIMARLFGFGVKRPQMAREVRYLLVSDKGELAEQLRQWSQIGGLRRIIPSHGEVIDEPAWVLRRIADELD